MKPKKFLNRIKNKLHHNLIMKKKKRKKAKIIIKYF